LVLVDHPGHLVSAQGMFREARQRCGGKGIIQRAEQLLSLLKSIDDSNVLQGISPCAPTSKPWPS